ncbi:hypothetical protein [Sulfurimonas sp. C5]|uniref:hypothetical protein n=1 Tax=Sulfurimonas sp. C5 TaxID=3036947 RepID=UPI002456104F|nr:hypothetical protein [Sulfurimonas sp. C5]MDH4945507.1 hypothetical protein [Sulfurimonas sp. C5]
MTHKKWFRISMITLLTLLTINSIFLYITDIYSVAHPNRKTFPTAFTQRFFVATYILNHFHEYDTLLFGSSRVQFINPQHIPNSNTYNLTIAEGIPEEYYLMLQLLLNKGIKLKSVLVGLDNFSHNISFTSHQNALETKSHYLLTGEPLYKFYSDFFFRVPTKRDFQDIQNRSKHLNIYKLHYDIIYNQRDTFKKHTYNQPEPNDPIYTVPTAWHGNNLKNSLQAIQDIKTLCDQHGIKTIFWINPIQHTSYNAMDHELFKKFKTKLSYITDYYDFSEPNEISNDNKNWLETSHFIPKIGDLIIKTIYTDKVYVKDFGIHVKKQEYK